MVFFNCVLCVLSCLKASEWPTTPFFGPPRRFQYCPHQTTTPYQLKRHYDEIFYPESFGGEQEIQKTRPAFTQNGLLVRGRISNEMWLNVLYVYN